MNTIQFTVVIPLYNKSECIVRALQSVHAQHHQAAEIIVVDDGSTDDSPQKVIDLGLPNLRLVRQTNQGVSAARNKGVKAASSDYVAFLDADDTWSPFFLARMAELIQRFPQAGLFASRYQKVLDNGEYIDAKIALTNWAPEGYEMDNYFEVAANGDLPFTMSSLVVDKTTFKQLGGFPVGEWMGEDQSFYVQAALKSRIVYSPAIESFYFLGAPGSACDKAPPTQICPFAERLLSAIKNGEVAHTAMAYKYVATHICDLAKRNIKHRLYGQALRLLANPVARAKPLHWSAYLTLSVCRSTLSRVSFGLIR
ncbi:glycosyltransferase family 2 protein [Pseudoalteromonas rubra]|uniref:Glycosyltransferase family 2 protein n=1 Tax=Pseudoalteromonas rubra TaxID=43658 RepID=A0A4Q7ELW6_9GAMM|nr:glycosyltransferase family 2 protein [Pseudoalteromonas rubra]RZM84303.1 glycosyltransferase family 2 protein [Pseudoalteromonas rubra]